MWRGSLLPLGCGVAPKTCNPVLSVVPRGLVLATASQSSGSKLPRHRFCDVAGYFGAAAQPNGGKPPRHRVCGAATARSAARP
ncbi:hypothetical protein F6R97_12645 [Pseudomonas sp. JV414]|nr:hypothetical protein [Pseudomonas sp. JV414]